MTGFSIHSWAGLSTNRESNSDNYSLAVYTNTKVRPDLIEIFPNGTIENGFRTYPKGTLVTITANSDAISTFNNWSDGDTSNTKQVSIQNDMELTANYSQINYVVAWDLYSNGNKDRSADYYSSNENKSSSLQLLHKNGTSTSFLLYAANSKLFGKNAASIQKSKSAAGEYFFQVCFNTKKYENIRIKANMLGLKTYYLSQNVEYSLDGNSFYKVGSFNIEKDSVWYEGIFSLPDDANQCDSVWVRFKADNNSTLIQNGYSLGTSISDIIVLGNIHNDGNPPTYLGSAPSPDENNILPFGKIILSFNEKIKLKEGICALLDNEELKDASIFGNSIQFPYSDLSYNSQHTFKLPANSVIDETNNVFAEPIEFSFQTIDREKVQKKTFDFIVGANGNFKDALLAAQAQIPGERFYIFFPNGEYNIGELTGDDNQMTSISTPNISLIGESPGGVVLYNKAIQESISSTATLYFKSSASNMYMQDITLLNRMDYRTGELKGRAAALMDKGKKNIYKNVKLLSNQDTYYSGNDRSYFETCDIHGTTDFICGGGDIFFNKCLIYLEEKSGPVIAAPASNGKWGYVFMDCTIDGFPITNKAYRLGRPWSNSPKCVYINTIMKKFPEDGGWGNPMNVVPAVFAEYNSMTAGGTPVDLSSRRTSYTKNDQTVTLNPVLSDDEAVKYTVRNVLSGSDNWKPQLFTAQIPAPVVFKEGNTLFWNDHDYALCWAIFKNGAFETFTHENNFTIPNEIEDEASYSICAVNEMGGLGKRSDSFSVYTSISHENATLKIVEKLYYSIDGRQLKAPRKGMNLIVTRFSNGSSASKKVYYLGF